MEILDKVEAKLTPVAQRRRLLPWWIKLFSGLFLITGVLATVAIPAALLGANVNFNIFGFDFNGHFTLEGVVALLIFICSGIVAYVSLGYDYVICGDEPWFNGSSFRIFTTNPFLLQDV